LTTVRLAQLGSGLGSPDLQELSRRVAATTDVARPVRFSPSPSLRFRVALAYEDRGPAVEREPAEAENPHLAAAVGELLRLAGADSDTSMTRFEAAVVQAADWWASHALPVPTSVDGPRLPGVIPAQRLESSERLSARLTDPTLLGLVSGPHPGRARSCQVAWRRGLTFWVAARLAAHGTTRQPPPETIQWWRAQLVSSGYRDLETAVSR
jgi:hypothetical protein